MDQYSDGFLSEPSASTVELLRQRYPDWRELLLKANRLAVKLQHSIDINKDSSTEVYGAVLFARTISSVQGSVILLERGLIPQARTVLRAALESYFALSAIARKPEIVLRLIESHEAEKKRLAKNMQQWKHPELQEIAKKHADTSDKYLTSTANAINTYDLAVVGGNEDWYRTVYSVFSWSVHAAATDLERHVVLEADRDIKELKNEPEVDEQESSWSCGVEILTKAIRALVGVFSTLDTQELEALEYIHVQLMSKQLQ